MNYLCFVIKEKVVPYEHSSLTKKEQVEMMFNRIAFRYDLMNRLLSFGIDVKWRNKMLKLLTDARPSKILDVATGTADVALMLVKLNPQQIIGVDISQEMIEVGRKKIKDEGKEKIISLIQADAENLPFPNNNFDAVTVSFGVRNFETLEKGLNEIYRVLKPDGRLIILEFSKPKTFPFKQLYSFYFTAVCPIIGKWITGDKEAYNYLHRSVEAFPEGDNFIKVLSDSGFQTIKCKPLTFGISSLYSASK